MLFFQLGRAVGLVVLLKIQQVSSPNGAPIAQRDDTEGVITDTDPTVKCFVELVHRYEGGQLSPRMPRNSESAMR